MMRPADPFPTSREQQKPRIPYRQLPVTVIDKLPPGLLLIEGRLILVSEVSIHGCLAVLQGSSPWQGSVGEKTCSPCEIQEAREGHEGAEVLPILLFKALSLMT